MDLRRLELLMHVADFGSFSKAAAVLAVGQAEAEAMDKRAEAFAHYNDAAVLQMLVEVLPTMAEKVAAPLASIDKLTVISTDGAAALPKQVSENLMQTLQLVKDTTGYDLTSIIDRFASREGAAPTVVKGDVEPSGPDAKA